MFVLKRLRLRVEIRTPRLNLLPTWPTAKMARTIHAARVSSGSASRRVCIFELRGYRCMHCFIIVAVAVASIGPVAPQQAKKGVLPAAAKVGHFASHQQTGQTT
jgi:hypothetical protein